MMMYSAVVTLILRGTMKNRSKYLVEQRLFVGIHTW